MIRQISYSIPFDRAYWVIPGRLLAGAYPGDQDPREAHQKLTGLLGCGIFQVINLMEEGERGHFGEPFVPYENSLDMLAGKLGIEVSTTRIPIRDASVPSPRTMKMILDEIDRSIAVARPVYTHCWGGRGRTGTVVGCYLVRHGLRGRKALERISYLRRNCADAHRFSPETEPQINMVLSWKE
jgi:hypothetical protein